MLHDVMHAPRAIFRVRCFDRDGRERWQEEARNLVVTEGRTNILERYFRGSSYTASWFLLLKGSGAPAASDTLANHPSWSELTPYSGNRPAITWNAASAGQIVSQEVSISINASATVAGAGCCTVASGNSGVLYNVGDFSSARSVQSGDTLRVTVTLTVTAA
jgi:hypothetical protein